MNLDRVFEEGFTTKEPGSQPMRGLGLALVRQVVQRRGGEITVATQGGAVFTVRLPAVNAETRIGRGDSGRAPRRADRVAIGTMSGTRP